MTEFDFYPHTIVWEITFACNMRCLHCGTSAGKVRPNELTTEEALALIDELAELRCRRITLSGGEPLLRPDWAQLARHINDRGMEPYIISNGFAVTPEIVDELEDIGFRNIGFSFDGTEKTHNHIRQSRKASSASSAMRYPRPSRVAGRRPSWMARRIERVLTPARRAASGTLSSRVAGSSAGSASCTGSSP